MNFLMRILVAGLVLQLISTTSFSQHSEKEIPLIFQENRGQWEKEITFKAVNSNSQIYFTKSQLYFTHSRASKKERNLNLEHLNWSLSFEGSNNNVAVSGEGNSRSVSNYLLGENHSIKNVRDFSSIIYHQIYNNIDLKYYTEGSRLKYDYILQPGFNINDIKIKCNGIKKLSIANEELLIEHEWGTIKELKPYSYQYINGEKVEIKIAYKITSHNTYGFEIEGGYNPSYSIILDPVTLIWGTYVGGNNASNGGYLYDLTTDKNGDIYATGYYPNTFPTTAGAYGKTFKGGYGDVFVFKLDKDGKKLLYATYIGGNDDDRGNGIAVNGSGEAYITGFTASTNNSFPTTKTFGTVLSGNNVFVCKLSADGSSLIYSTYIGGQNHDIANGIEIDSKGNAYIVGETASTEFPVTTNALTATYQGGNTDAFVIKLNPSGNNLLYSTFIGGSLEDRARALKIKDNGEIYLTGITKSTNFPTSANAYDKSWNGDFDAFVTKLDKDGKLDYSTFVGGLAAEEGTSIDINQKGEAFICGYTFSPNYPTTIPGQKLQGLSDVLVTRLNEDGSGIIYSRYVGGNQMEEGSSIIVNALNHAIIAGTTKSFDFPIVLSGIDEPNPTKDKEYQVFAMLLGETGALIKKSIKLGGSNDDYKVPSLSFPDKNYICNVILGFTSHSTDLSTTDGVFQKTKLNGDHSNDQPAVFNLNFGPDSLPKMEGQSFIYCPKDANEIKQFCAPADYDPDYPIKYIWSNGATSRCLDASYKDMDPVLTIKYSNGCESKDASFKAEKYILPSVNLGPDKPICKNQPLILNSNANTNATIGEYSILWSTGEKTESISATGPDIYWVELRTACDTIRDSISLHEIDVPFINPGTSRTYCFPTSIVLDGNIPNDVIDRTYSWSTGEKTPTITVIKGGTYTLSITNQCGTVSANHVVNEEWAPVVNLGPDTSICQNISIVLDPRSLNGISYLWSTGATSKTITVSTPGTYWVEVANACGKTKASINVTAAVQVPVVNLGPDQKICQPFSLTLNANSPGNNYYWSTGATTESITVNTGGTYSVTVTNGCGTTTDVIEITASPSLNLELGPDQSICAPQTIVLSAQNPGGNVNYLWSTGEKISSITVATSGTYTVTVSNECGSATDKVIVTSFASVPKFSIGKDTSICANTDFKIEAKPNNSSFLWNTGEITSFITANITKKDTFWVDAFNACGSSRDSIILDTIPMPTVNLGKDTSICSPANITLNAFNTNATYLWSTGATTPSITVNSTGTYYVDVKRCTVVRGIITITTNTQLPVVNLGSDKTICTDFSLMLDAGQNPGAKYEWLPEGEKTQTINVTQGNLYIVKVTNGCGSTSDSLNIIGKPITELGDDMLACEKDTVTLDAGNKWAGATYEWSTNETSQTIKVHQSGVYTVKVTNVCGVTNDKISISMDTEKCVIELGPDLRRCAPVTIKLDAENPGSKYLWSTGETTQTIDVNSTGKYRLWVTNGCGTTPDSINIIVDNGLPKVDLGNDAEFCNPFAKVLDAGNANMYYKWFPDGQTTKSITASQAGTYSVKVTNACGSDSNGVTIKEFFEPKIDLGEDKSSCQTPVILDAGNPGSNYFWSTNETTQTITAATTGNYAVNIYNICGITSDDIFVVIDQGLPAIDLGKDTTLCTPDGLVLNAGQHPRGTIVWAPAGQASETIVVKNAGTYSVSISNSCGNSSDEIIIGENPVLIKAAPDTSICPGNSVQLRTIQNNSYTYLWTPDESLTDESIHNPVALPTESTKYVIRVDDGKCYNVDTARVTVHPLVNPQIHASALEGYIPLTVNFSNPHPTANQLWIFGDGQTFNGNNPSHNYREEKPFTVILITTTDKGCVESDTVTIHPFSLFIPNLITPNKDGKNDVFDLTKDFVHLEVEIYNRWGELVFKRDGYIDEWDGINCADGIYYYSIKDTRFNKEFKGWVQLTRSTE